MQRMVGPSPACANTAARGSAIRRKPGIGQVGAGTVKAPLKCFDDALAAVAKTMGIA